MSEAAESALATGGELASVVAVLVVVVAFVVVAAVVVAPVVDAPAGVVGFEVDAAVVGAAAVPMLPPGVVVEVGLGATPVLVDASGAPPWPAGSWTADVVETNASNPVTGWVDPEPVVELAVTGSSELSTADVLPGLESAVVTGESFVAVAVVV